MSVSVNGTNGVTFNDASVQNTAATGFGFKSRIINPAMVIDQRNAGASVTASTTGTLVYTVDRWAYYADQASKFTVQQNAGSVTPPNGFVNYLGVTSTSAYSVGASEGFSITQNVEGFNISDFGWGTANAQAITLSFWVRSSLTGTFGGSLRNSAGNRSYPFSYSIPTANTWTSISITIAGDTSGTWLTTNGIGIRMAFSLGSGATVSGTAGAWAAANYYSATGATSVVGTANATFYITGVQLEKGSTATSFDYRPYGTELTLCQRYYWKYVSGNSSALCVAAQYDASTVYGVVTFPVTMRSAPTTGCSTGSGYYNFVRNGASDLFNSITVNSYTSNSSVEFYNNSEISGTAGQAGWIRTGDANSFIAFTAEL